MGSPVPVGTAHPNSQGHSNSQAALTPPTVKTDVQNHVMTKMGWHKLKGHLHPHDGKLCKEKHLLCQLLKGGRHRGSPQLSCSGAGLGGCVVVPWAVAKGTQK